MLRGAALHRRCANTEAIHPGDYPPANIQDRLVRRRSKSNTPTGFDFLLKRQWEINDESSATMAWPGADSFESVRQPGCNYGLDLRGVDLITSRRIKRVFGSIRNRL